jgi:3'-phosphoadenosine 5'-phosphosulfate (PAPS) 3'-phosphatase
MQGTFPFALMPFKKAVDKAHQLCQTLRMENLEYLDKSYEFVTLADFGTQVIINKALCSISPKQRIISEETSEEFLKVTTPEQRAQIVIKVSQVLNEPSFGASFITCAYNKRTFLTNK